MPSKRVLDLLGVLFAENSNLQLPVGTAETVVELREWLKQQYQVLSSPETND